MLFLETQITNETLLFTDRQFASVCQNESEKGEYPEPTANV